MRRAPPGLSLPQQALALSRRFPDGRLSLTGAKLIWTGELTPTALSCSYAVRVTYRRGRQPKVVVIRPRLLRHPDEILPHTYGDGSLCLHEREDWNPRMSLADSTVPWAAEWLMYYELWRGTGKWQGGGVWPPGARSDSNTAALAQTRQNVRLCP